MRIRTSIAAASLLAVTSCWPARELSSYSRAGAGGGAAADASGVAEPAPSGGASSPPPPSVDAGAGRPSPASGGGGLPAGAPVAPPGGGGSPPRDAGAPALDAATAGEAAAQVCEAPSLSGPAGSCYRVITTPLSWADAREGCRAIGPGWDLAQSADGADNEFLGSSIEVESWIGASDALMEGLWIWVPTSEPLWIGGGAGRAVRGAFTRWNITEPNGGSNSDCARMLPALPGAEGLRGAWADLECAQPRGSICERYD